jgi:hypothetical protein
MQGKFARIINLVGYGFGTAVFILAIVATSTFQQVYHLAQASAAFGIIVGLAQMIVCFLALTIKCANWVVWVIAHAVLLLLSLIGSAMELASIAGVCYPGMQIHPRNAGPPLGGGMGHPPARNADGSCAATNYLFGVVFFFDFLFCIVGLVLVILKRAGTIEKGGPGILQVQAENLVQKVSSTLMSKSSKTASATAQSSANM